MQYGPRITAIVLYLYVGQFLSKKRTAQALAELFGTPVSDGTVAAHGRPRRRRARRVPRPRSKTGSPPPRWPGSTRPGCGWPGSLHWVHCARTGKYTLITCHPKRGRKGIDAAGVLGRFRGVAVHDAWAPYDTYADVEHQLCCAHALRELAAVTDTAPAGCRWCWATQAADALVAMQKLVAEATAAGRRRDRPGRPRHPGPALPLGGPDRGSPQTSARTSKVMRKHHALARRLRDRQHDYLRFTTDWRIPPDNNGSERDIRMIKLRQKVSGCLRTLTGARQFCAIRSYLSTAAKHGQHLFDTLVMLAEGRPWMPETT